MKNNQIHLEIPVDNIERAQKFYTELFGWEITKFDSKESGMDYWGVNIAGECKYAPNLTAGIINRQSPDQKITNYIVVESVKDSLENIEKFDGKVIMPLMELPKVGSFAICSDTENNVFGLWQNNEEALEEMKKNKKEDCIVPSKNNAIHFEIPADDVPRAKNFYEKVFGWKIDKMEMSGCDMDYWGINITGEDFKKIKPTICGGLMKRKNPEQQGILNYVVVDSEVETFVPQIEALGGKIIVPAMEVPNVGKFVIFQDTEGSMLAVWKCNTSCGEAC